MELNIYIKTLVCCRIWNSCPSLVGATTTIFPAKKKLAILEVRRTNSRVPVSYSFSLVIISNCQLKKSRRYFITWDSSWGPCTFPTQNRCPNKIPLIFNKLSPQLSYQLICSDSLHCYHHGWVLETVDVLRTSHWNLVGLGLWTIFQKSVFWFELFQLCAYQFFYFISCNLFLIAHIYRINLPPSIEPNGKISKHH